MRQNLVVYSLLTLLATVAASKPATAEVALYDNSDARLPGETRIGPSIPQESFAQPFRLLGHDSIASVSINVARTGGLEGVLRFSIWNDDGQGKPGQLVAELGSVDADQLDDLSIPFPPALTLPTVEFNSPITGLDLQATYFVVSEFNDADVGTLPNGYPKSPVFGGLFNDRGTNDANEMLDLDRGVSWRTFGQLGAGRRWMQMSIFANSSALLGDLNDNGELDVADIDILASAIRQGLDDSVYDVNKDGEVNPDDHTYWVKNVANTFFGDANLDGEFSSGDLTLVFQSGEYGDNVALNSTWGKGDWDGDGDFGSGDLVVAFQDGGYGIGPKAAAQAIPEPSSLVMLVLGVFMLVGRTHRTEAS